MEGKSLGAASKLNQIMIWILQTTEKIHKWDFCHLLHPSDRSLKQKYRSFREQGAVMGLAKIPIVGVRYFCGLGKRKGQFLLIAVPAVTSHMIIYSPPEAGFVEA